MAMTGISRLGPLVLRLGVAAPLIYHGYQALFVDEFQTFVARVQGFGFPEPEILAHVAAWGALAGGVLLVLGFVARLAGLVNAATLFVGIWKLKLGPDVLAGLKDNFAGPEGYAFALVMFVACLSIVFTGAGALSIDGALAGRSSRKETVPVE